MRPFLDHANQHELGACISERTSTRMMLGESLTGTLGTDQTRRSPSAVCVASMSVFWRDDEPCHASPVILEGALAVLRV